jgi:preprotein translocase subunit SecD
MSNNPLFWKFILILAVIVAAAFSFYPPEERINLGLDLKGGLHILMQVETGTALTYELNLTTDRLGQQFKSKNLAYASIIPTDEGTLEIRGTEPARREEVRQLLTDFLGRWQILEVGGGTWRVELPPDSKSYIESNAIEVTLSILRTRIDSLGVSSPTVQQQGIRGDRILIQLPGVEDPERVKDILGDPAVLEWKAVSYPPTAPDPTSWFPPDTKEALIAQFGGTLPDDTVIYPQEFPTPEGGVNSIWWPLKRVSTVIGNDLRTAYRTADEWGDPAVSFELSQDAGQRFEAATREYLGLKMAIVLGGVEDKKVISAPVIEGVIRDIGVIRGGFDVTRAEDLALQLRSGAIPTDVKIIEERTVGPSLGRDSIRAGLTAGLSAFCCVMLFMLVYYRLSGVNAVVALALNMLLVFGALGALPFLFSGVQATLTLPGIAGLILTVGMAVDSNVLIFERIREEMRLGKTVRSAVEQGFGRAFRTILDCNVTTLVAAFFLFSYGTGPVKGFAVTLTIGLLASMFTAVFVSRQLFEFILSRREGADSLSI